MADQLQGLSLQERPGDVPLARIQRLFSFRLSGSGHFPQPEKESFQECLALIPSGRWQSSAGVAVLLHVFVLRSWVKVLKASVSSHRFLVLMEGHVIPFY